MTQALQGMRDASTDAAGARVRVQTRTGCGSDCEAAFGALQAACERASAARPAGLYESSYNFAGHQMHLRVTGGELAERLHSAFAHLEENSGTSARLEEKNAEAKAPRLAVELWGGSAADVSRLKASAAGESASGHDGPTHSAESFIQNSPDGRFVLHHTGRSVLCLDRRGWRIAGCVSSAEQPPAWERAKPLSLLLAVWLNDRDVQVIHAGLVARGEEGVLLAGPSGVGKSTSALACVDAGFDFLGDDFVGLQADGRGSYTGHSLYGSVAVGASQLARFPRLRDCAGGGSVTREEGEEKRVIFLPRLYPTRLRRAVAVRAVALPRLVDAPSSRVLPATKGEALRSLAPSSIIRRAAPAAQCLKRLARLADDVPSYWIEVGRDVRQIPGRVADLLERAGRV
jgi:hypothetical protein